MTYFRLWTFSIVGLLMFGCGGSALITRSPLSRPGQLIIEIAWPKKSAPALAKTGLSLAPKLIPLATAKITIDISDANGPVKSVDVMPGDPQVTVPGLPAADLSLDAEALDQNGSILAKGKASATTGVNAPTTAKIQMTTDIVKLVTDPATISIPLGQSLTVSVAGVNSEGQNCLLSPGNLLWDYQAGGFALPSTWNPRNYYYPSEGEDGITYITLNPDGTATYTGETPGNQPMLVQDAESNAHNSSSLYAGFGNLTVTGQGFYIVNSAENATKQPFYSYAVSIDGATPTEYGVPYGSQSLVDLSSTPPGPHTLILTFEGGTTLGGTFLANGPGDLDFVGGPTVSSALINNSSPATVSNKNQNVTSELSTYPLATYRLDVTFTIPDSSNSRPKVELPKHAPARAAK
jgi:hypothetical protein